MKNKVKPIHTTCQKFLGKETEIELMAYYSPKEGVLDVPPDYTKTLDKLLKDLEGTGDCANNYYFTG